MFTPAAQAYGYVYIVCAGTVIAMFPHEGVLYSRPLAGHHPPVLVTPGATAEHQGGGFLTPVFTPRTLPTDAGSLTLPPTLLTFTPAGGSSTGLYLLPSVASSACSESGLLSSAPISDSSSSLSARGPYNPAVVLPPKVAKKILDLRGDVQDISLNPPHACPSRTSQYGWKGSP